MQEQLQEARAERHIAAIEGLQELAKDYPQVNIPVTHLFSVGYYARIITIPAGTMAVGKIHKTRNQFTLLSGIMRTSNGYDEIKEIEGVYHCTTDVGFQRIVYAVTDCKVMCVHKTNKTTLADIEAEVIAKDREELCRG